MRSASTVGAMVEGLYSAKLVGHPLSADWGNRSFRKRNVVAAAKGSSLEFPMPVKNAVTVNSRRSYEGAGHHRSRD